MSYFGRSIFAQIRRFKLRPGMIKSAKLTDPDIIYDYWEFMRCNKTIWKDDPCKGRVFLFDQNRRSLYKPHPVKQQAEK